MPEKRVELGCGTSRGIARSIDPDWLSTGLWLVLISLSRRRRRWRMLRPGERRGYRLEGTGEEWCSCAGWRGPGTGGYGMVRGGRGPWHSLEWGSKRGIEVDHSGSASGRKVGHGIASESRTGSRIERTNGVDLRDSGQMEIQRCYRPSRLLAVGTACRASELILAQKLDDCSYVCIVKLQFELKKRRYRRARFYPAQRTPARR